MLFTGGLSLMFSIAALDHMQDFGIQDKANEALQICEGLLTQFSSQMKDSFYYAAVFQALHRETTRRSALFYQQFLTTAVPTRRGSPTNGPTDHGQLPMYATGTGLSFQPWNQNLTTDTISMSTQGQIGTACAINTEIDDLAHNNLQLEESVLSGIFGHGSSMMYLPPNVENSYWDGLTDGWLSMELGVGEYAYGDPQPDLNMWDQLHIDLVNPQL
jgi:hypothetical protein